MQKTVAVVSSSIGRAELERAILSVKAQTYPCKHYVFVDGNQFAEKARKILDKYPDVIATYLPMNTGANGWVNSSINAIAPFLVKEDIVCYLDDDNWYEPNHVAEAVAELARTGADYVYSLRNFVDGSGKLICTDEVESLGFWISKLPDPIKLNIQLGEYCFQYESELVNESHIDTNCYAFTHKTALLVARSWYSGVINDRNVLNTLKALNLKWSYTGKFTVNYFMDVRRHFVGVLESIESLADPKAIEGILNSILIGYNQLNIQGYGNQRPWVKP